MQRHAPVRASPGGKPKRACILRHKCSSIFSFAPAFLKKYFSGGRGSDWIRLTTREINLPYARISIRVFNLWKIVQSFSLWKETSDFQMERGWRIVFFNPSAWFSGTLWLYGNARDALQSLLLKVQSLGLAFQSLLYENRKADWLLKHAEGFDFSILQPHLVW